MEKLPFRVVTYINGYPNAKKEFSAKQDAENWAAEQTEKFWIARNSGKTSHSYKYMVQNNY